jgi:response regulator RpfG family c-di-GMP phosphodiesterase
MILYRHQTVLLVDDSLIDNLISCKILQNSFYAENVLINDSPKNAIKFIRERVIEGSGVPEIIFLDIRMPEMNGFDFLNKLNSIPGIDDFEIKIYILSASLDPRDRNKLKDFRSVSSFIGKPLTESVLQDI